MKDQTRREFLKSLGFVAGSAVGLPTLLSSDATGQASRKKRPNIIFIMTDDHASHALSCYDSKINKTPNLDRIANEGMLFKNSFCTNSICAPCRAVILTGKYSHLNGILDNRQKFDGSQQTFPKLLQRAGYKTAMIGKWHLKTDPTGFDYWNVLPGQGAYYNPAMKEMGRQRKYTGYTTDIITDHALKWLKGLKPGEPFCLMYQHKAPHRRWEPGPKHLTIEADTLLSRHRRVGTLRSGERPEGDEKCLRRRILRRHRQRVESRAKAIAHEIQGYYRFACVRRTGGLSVILPAVLRLPCSTLCSGR